jgi:hypothetical protein
VSDGYLVLINAAFSLPHLDSKLTSNLGFFYWNSADNVAISKIVELLAIFLLFCKVVSDESNRGLPSSFKPRTLRSLEVWRITVSPLSLHPWGEELKIMCANLLRRPFLSEQTSHQQPASSTILSEQTSTSH